MSTRLSAWDGDKVSMHTAVDDLELFLWVLVYILKEFGMTSNLTVDQLAERLSSHSIPLILGRESTMQHRWLDVDAVFGGLILEWLAISQEASFVVGKHVKTVLGSGDNVDLQQGAFDRLEKYCRMVYTELIRTGYKHLESIRGYSDWKAVVEANPGWDS